MNKNQYQAWVQNNSGASENVATGFGNFTSIREAENFCRSRYASGWTVHIEKVWIDGDGQSYSEGANEEVKTFKIR